MKMNVKIVLSLLCMLAAVSARADEFTWSAASAEEILAAVRQQSQPETPASLVATPTEQPRLILVKGGGISQPSYLQQCRMGDRMSHWTWFGMAREQVCSSKDCPGLECRQAKWTGFTPDCSQKGACGEWKPVGGDSI